MVRLAESKRVRSVVIGAPSATPIATGVTQDGVNASYVFQDDVTIIGCSIMVEFDVKDAHSNADGQYNGIAELSRQAVRSAPGIIHRTECLHACWNAAISIGGQGNKVQSEIMFPEGYGVEVDEGEGVNLLYYANYLGAGGDLNFYANAVIWYVER